MKLFILIFMALSLEANGRAINTEFIDGDVLSADVLNTAFEKINQSATGFTEDYLKGSWECVNSEYSGNNTYDENSGERSINQYGFPQLMQNWIFGENNSFDWQFGHPESVNIKGISYHTIHGMLLIKHEWYPPALVYTPVKILDNDFTMYRDHGNRIDIVFCARNDAKPEELGRISITESKEIYWSDINSDNSLIIERKKSNTDEDFKVVEEIASGRNEYLDINVTVGDSYYYRAKVKNTFGESNYTPVVEIKY